MPPTRRDFVATGLAGLAGACAASALTTEGLLADAGGRAPAALPPVRMATSVVRYANPGAAATAYRRAITQVVVEGTSPTSTVIKH